MATAAAVAAATGAGTVVLVDAALAPYERPDLRWLVRQHVLVLLQDFPTLSPSVDTYTSDTGASTVLLNARGVLAVSSDLAPVLLTLWLPREYPYLPPLVYVFPVSGPSAPLARDHPFVDHRTDRVRHTLLYIDDWPVPRSSLAGLVGSLAGALRVCHPLTPARAATTPAEEERARMRSILADELAAALGRDAAAFRGRVDGDILALSSMQATLRARAGTMDRAVRDLEDERIRLERAVTASLAHRGRLVSWLREASRRRAAPPDNDAGGAVLLAVATHAASGDADADADGTRWLESKASELAVDDTMDALAHALGNGNGELISFHEYIKRVKILAREQFLNCYATTQHPPRK